MISRFDNWLNEEEKVPAKPALYKVGDKVLLKYKEHPIEMYGKYEKAYAQHGGLAEVKKVEAKSGKWIYYLKLITGGLSHTGRSYRSSTTYYSAKDNKEIKSSQADLTIEDLKKFLDLYEKAQFTENQEVTFKNVTRKVRGVATEPTIEKGEVYYLLSGVYEPVPEKELVSDEKLTPEQEEVLIEEISKKLKLSMKNDEKDLREIKSFKFEVNALDLKESVQGVVFFREETEMKKFVEDLQKFIDSKVDKDLQSCLNEGKPSKVEIKERTSWKGGTIVRENLREAARNLGINMKELFQKKRGTISGKKFGV